MWYSARHTLDLILPWVSGNSHYPSTEKRQPPSGILLFVLSPVSTPDGDVLTTSDAFLHARGLCSNVTAMGPQGPFLNTQGHTGCPGHPAEEGGCAHALEHRVYLFIPFSISSFPFWHPSLVPYPSVLLTGMDRTVEQAVCWMFYSIVLFRPASSSQSHPSLSNHSQYFCFSTFLPPGSFCLITVNEVTFRPECV